MHHRLRFGIGALALITAAALSDAPAPAWAAGPSAAHLVPTVAQSAETPCFLRREWRGGWKATPDGRTLYIRVAGSIYRLDLQSAYSLLKDPFAVLINRGSADSICRPLDFRLTVSNRAGIMQWPIVKEMTRLTPEEAAALPRKLRP